MKREIDETYIECGVCHDVPRDGECRHCARGQRPVEPFRSVDPWNLAASA